MTAITGSMPFTMLDNLPVHLGRLPSARLKRAYATSVIVAERIFLAATSLNMVALTRPVAGGWIVLWAPDWEDFWPA